MRVHLDAGDAQLQPLRDGAHRHQMGVPRDERASHDHVLQKPHRHPRSVPYLCLPHEHALEGVLRIGGHRPVLVREGAEATALGIVKGRHGGGPPHRSVVSDDGHGLPLRSCRLLSPCRRSSGPADAVLLRLAGPHRRVGVLVVLPHAVFPVVGVSGTGLAASASSRGRRSSRGALLRLRGAVLRGHLREHVLLGDRPAPAARILRLIRIEVLQLGLFPQLLVLAVCTYLRLLRIPRVGILDLDLGGLFLLPGALPAAGEKLVGENSGDEHHHDDEKARLLLLGHLSDVQVELLQFHCRSPKKV